MPAIVPQMRAPRSAAAAGVPAPMAGWSATIVVLGALGWITWDRAGWVAMSVLALAEFFLLKVAMLRAVGGVGRLTRRLGFFAFYPGMNARAFLAARRASDGNDATSELSFALVKMT